jgi:tRNA threonylcarbamoyladenosine modification (KEOPS) complex Cgi121 subunit
LSRVLTARADIETGDAEETLRAVRARHPRLIVQMAGFRRVPEARAVAMIAEQTLRAARTGALLASKPEVDLLLRLAGTTQITLAIRKVGYGSGGTVVLVAAGQPRDVSKLRRELDSDKRYSVLAEQPASKAGLDAVEAAAILGTRS